MMYSMQNHKQQYSRTLCYVPFVACRFPSVLLCCEALLHSLRLRQLPANRARKNSRRAGHQTCHAFGRASMNMLFYLELSSSARMLCCIAARKRAEKTGEGHGLETDAQWKRQCMRMQIRLACPGCHRVRTSMKQAWPRAKLANSTD